MEYSSNTSCPLSSPKKKILLFIDWYLPGYRAGGPIRSCSNMIEHLKELYDFSVVTRDTDYHETNSYKGIKSDEWNILPDGTRVFYFSEKNLSSGTIRKVLDKEDFDSVYINGIFSYYFSILPLRILKGKNKKVITAARGMLGEGAMSVKKTKKIFFLFTSKLTGLFSDVMFQASNKQEIRDVQKYFGKKVPVLLAPNLPRKMQLEARPDKRKEKGAIKIASIARISPEKNTKFALEVLKHVKGNVIFDLFGTVNNVAYWNECKNIIESLPLTVAVNHKGAIPSDKTIEALSEYDFMFMPSLSENFGHTILESFIAGTPVVISDQTMWKNLPAVKAGWDISLLQKEKFMEILNSCV